MNIYFKGDIMIKTSAPGKLILSGEWAVLEVGNPAIVASVNKRIFANIRDSSDKKIHITIRDFGINDLKATFEDNKLKFEKKLGEKEKKDTLFIKSAIESFLNYSGSLKPFKIETWGDKTTVNAGGKVKKVGFGSSAASVVAVVAGLFKFNLLDINTKKSKDEIYKLSTIAHYFAQEKVGSAFDVAASTYGGILVYRRFDPGWFVNQFEIGKSIKRIVESDWPGLYIESLNLDMPENFNLIVGWTRESASTSDMIRQMNTWKETNKDEYNRILSDIANLVEELIIVLKSGKEGKALELIRKNEEYLRELGEKSGVNIETKTLKILSDTADKYGGAGKLSGAGGGDLGIAVCYNQEIKEKIKEEWKKTGIIELIETGIDFNGFREEF
jgi:phosphomevalonate kinase